MKKSLRGLCLSKIMVAAILCFCVSPAKAQSGDSLNLSQRYNFGKQYSPCGVDNAFLLGLIDTGGGSGILAPVSYVSGYPASAIDTCGKFAIYYDDRAEGMKFGFDDTTMVGGSTLGQIRRETYCHVLTYIQSIFDFSKVSSGDLLKIHVMQSFANVAGYHAPPDVWYLAKAAPYYATPANSFIGGYVNDYVRTGIDGAPNYHAQMTVNFDSSTFGTITYENSDVVPFPGCDIDLFSTLLHESGHALGWLSFLGFIPPSADSIFAEGGLALDNLHPYSTNATNTFTKLDSSIMIGSVFPGTSLQHLILGTPGVSLYVNPSAAINANLNYWMNDLTAPDNYPVYSGVSPHVGDPNVLKSYISHLDDDQASYSRREHVSPGDREEYVMSPYGLAGVTRRQYAKGEIKSFCDILGYKYIGADSLIKVRNHRPFSKKMAGLDLWNQFGVIAETVPADYMMTNNGGSISIDLAALVASGDLSDEDGDVISVDTSTLANFRGCGDSTGNNHNLLTLSSGNTVITYTPRKDFYGRAQFGFNLYDNKEDGSFYVVTIDVKQGTYPVYTAGSNMVLNPGFENGTELRTNANQAIHYSVVTEYGFHEGKWQGASFSDGHPYCTWSSAYEPYGAGIAVENTLIDCSISLPGDAEGSTVNSFPTVQNPLLSVGAGSRYQPFIAQGSFSFYYLTHALQSCHRYNLEFDVYSTTDSFANIPIQVGLKNDTSNFLLPVFNSLITDTLHAITSAGWTHISLPMWYCNANPSHILFIQGLALSFAIDNLSLTEDTTLPPLLVSVTQTGLPGCHTQLTAHATDTACSVSYLWNATSMSSLASIHDTVISNVAATYTVTVSDGCRDTTATFKISEMPPGPISGPVTFCTGGLISLSDTVAGGAWYSHNTAIATIGSAGIVTGISAGTDSIYYVMYCADTARYAVTVSPPPVGITGVFTVCAGSATTLSDAVAGGTWSSGNIAIATVGATTGKVTGIAGGTATITYTVGVGCFVTQTVTVTTTPHLGAITFPDFANVCIGSTIVALYPYGEYGGDTLTAHGTWTVSDTEIASLLPPTVGIYGVVVEGVSAGTVTITYSVSNSCGTSTTTQLILVNPLPSAITGVANVCIGATVLLTDTSGTGNWSSGDTAIATVNPITGLVTGVTAGTATISYALSSTGCYVAKTITVNTSPLPFTAPTEICPGTAVILHDSTAGGYWTSNSPVTATIGSATGLVTGIATGVTTISYITACGSTHAELFVSPTPEPITGPGSVCMGSTIMLTEPIGSGFDTWSSSDTTIATVGSGTGIVTAVSIGSVTITCNIFGCTRTYIVTVNPLPAAILGTANICTGGTVALSDATPGGEWISTTPFIATVGSSTGIVSGVSAGTVNIFYQLLSTSCSIGTTLLVNPTPVIAGPVSVCTGSSIVVGASPSGGTWSSGTTSIATIAASSGMLTGIAPGTSVITDVLSTGCSATATVTVNPLPLAITGTTHICTGGTTTLSDAIPGGTWNSGTPGIASIGATTGLLTGIATGTATITYTVSATGCFVTTIVTISAAPALISGVASVCVGATTTLSDPTPGGTWSSIGIAIGTVSGSGVVTGVTPGTVTILYTTGIGCAAAENITVNPSPAAITGSSVFPCSSVADTLGDATAGGIWSSSDLSLATISATGIVAATGLGTDTISYTLDDGCAATFIITMTGGTDPCSPCYGLPNGYSSLGGSGMITSDVGPGNYYIANDVIVSGNITFTGAIIEIAPGVTITLDPYSFLSISKSHLFGTCQMWKGIVLGSSLVSMPLSSARMYVGNGTLIEDAITAVSIIRPVAPHPGLYIFESDNTIFNRCITGVDIEHYTPMSNTSYPFLIRNTVMSSRDFKTAMAGGYPYTWPLNDGVYGLKTYWGGADMYTPKMNMYSPTGTGTAPYNWIPCKNNQAPNIGIKLDSVGTNIPNTALHFGVPIPLQYAEIVIGDTTNVGTNIFQNLFEGEEFGIHAINTNVSSVNNVFNGMWPSQNGGFPALTYIGGDAIYAAETNDDINENRLQVYSPNGSTTHNMFYGFRVGVEAANYFEVRGQYNYMINKTPTIPTLLPYGQFGYSVKTSQYDTVDISYDTLNNVINGIAVWATQDPYSIGSTFGPHYLGQFTGVGNIYGNVIQPSPLPFTSTMTQSVTTAISVQNMLTSLLGVTYMGQMNVNGNYLYDVYNGVQMTGWKKQPANALFNQIRVRPRTANPHWMQYGVDITACLNSTVADNYVYGSSASGVGSDSIRAYYAATNTGLTMNCNGEESLGRGFEFYLNNPGTKWFLNNMQSNGKGFVLNGGIIGPQYNNLFKNNRWSGTWTTPQTYVDNHAPSASSPLYVYAEPLTDPTINLGNPTDVIHWYNTTTSLFALPAGGVGVCPSYVIEPPSNALYEQIAQQHVDYTTNIVPSNWMGQYSLWNAMLMDSTIADSSATIAVFGILAENSRYAYLSAIENDIAVGDYTDATTLLGLNIDSMANTSWDSVTQVQMADGTAADNIVENYQNFYGLYMKYATASLTGSDSLAVLAMAQLCPEINGAVVFQARTLYSEIYNDLTVFNDDSCMAVDSTYIAERHSQKSPPALTTVQNYKLYPNPNDGNFMLQQYIPADGPVQVEILDAVGRKLFNEQVQFANAKSQLNMSGYVPGMYLLEITDSKNRIFRYKFVINK